MAGKLGSNLITSCVKIQNVSDLRQERSNQSQNDTKNVVSGQQKAKTKRVRTTFAEEQLAVLQTHFQIDSNPDGADLERIATMTGLSKRVTQVWFQVTILGSPHRSKRVKLVPNCTCNTCNISLTCIELSVVSRQHFSHKGVKNLYNRYAQKFDHKTFSKHARV